MNKKILLLIILQAESLKARFQGCLPGCGWLSLQYTLTWQRAEKEALCDSSKGIHPIHENSAFMT